MPLDPTATALGAAVADSSLPDVDRLVARLALADYYDEIGYHAAAKVLRHDGSVVPSGPERGRLGWEAVEFVPDANGCLSDADGGTWSMEYIGLVDLVPGDRDW